MVGKREMTLVEWVGRLPKKHKARQEYDQLAEDKRELIRALEHVMKINDDIRINLIEFLDEGPERNAFWMSVKARDTAHTTLDKIKAREVEHGI